MLHFKNMKKINLILILLLGITISSCGDFLKEQSQDLCYATTCSDLNEVMIGGAYMSRQVNTSIFTYAPKSKVSTYYPYLYIMDDDATEFVYGVYKPSYNEPLFYNMRNFYNFAKDPFINGDSKEIKDADTENIYKHIGVVNVVLGYVDEFESEPILIRNALRAECFFLRAAYHFQLLNIYAKPYDKTTAASDMGIPVNTTRHIEDKFFKRESVQGVYDLIVNDLTQSIECFEGQPKPKNQFRASEKAARLLLSRVYLYLCEWRKAEEMTQSIIEMGITLQNINGKDFGQFGEVDNFKKKYYFSQNNPEILFTMGNAALATIMPQESQIGINPSLSRLGVYSASSSLLSSYEDGVKNPAVKDLRLQCFFQASAKIPEYYPIRKSPVSNDATLRTPDMYETYVLRSAEVYLNLAEAYAMLDESGKAIESLSQLFSYRYETGKYPNISGLSGKELVDFIRAERRRELCFEGHRWFDLRRYAVCVPEKYQVREPIRHNAMTANGGGKIGIYDGHYTLKPYGSDAAWVLPFPKKELEFNEGELIDNPKRSERTKERD